MDYADAVRLYDRVVNSVSIVPHDGELFYIYDPRPMDRQLANLRYEEVVDELNGSEVISQQLSVRILESKHLWNEIKEKELESINSRRDALNKELPRLEFQSQRKRMILKELGKLEIQGKLLLTQKNVFSTNTVEYLATVEKYKKLVFLLTYKHGKRVWKDWCAFIRTEDTFVTKLMNSAFFNPDLTETNLRFLSHNEPWRSTWVASKKSGNLFSRPMADMTDYQRIIVSWSLVYDSVYEHPDCPSDEAINDDLQLDAWLLIQSEKRKSQQTGNEVSKMISDNPRINDAQEVGIIVDSFEDAKRVYNLNDRSVKSTLRQRNEKIRTEGSVSEGNMPDTKFDLQMQANKMAQEKHNR